MIICGSEEQPDPSRASGMPCTSGSDYLLPRRKQISQHPIHISYCGQGPLPFQDGDVLGERGPVGRGSSADMREVLDGRITIAALGILREGKGISHDITSL